MSGPFHNIRGKFLLYLLPPLIAATLVVSVIFGMLTDRNFQDELAIKQENLLSLNSAALAGPVWNLGTDNIQRILKVLVLDADVVSAAVYNEEGKLLAEEMQHLKTRVTDPDDIVSVKQNISYQTPAKTYSLGWLEVRFRTDRIDEVIFSQILRDSLLLVLLLLVMVASAMVANRVIVGRPLDKILAAVRSAGGGGGHTRIDWQSNDEFGTLIDAYNAMQERLQSEEEELRRSRERLGSILAAAPFPIVISSLENNGLILYINERAEALFGFAPSGAIGRYAYEFYLNPEERKDMLAQVTSRGLLENFEVELRSVQGRRFWAALTATPMDYGGEHALFVAVSDITERRQAEQERARTLSLLDAALQAQTEGLVIVSNDLSPVVWNRTFEEIWHLPEDWHRRPTAEERFQLLVSRVHDPDTFIHKADKIRTDPDCVAVDHIRLANGRILERHTRPFYVGDKREGRVWSYRDITERQKAEYELRKAQLAAATAEARMRDAIERFDGAFLLWDADDKLVLANSRTQLLHDHAAEIYKPGRTYEQCLRDAVNRGGIEVPVPDTEAWIAQQVQHHRQGERTAIRRFPNGRWYRFQDQPTAEGGIVGVAFDITELKRTEAELRDGEELLRSILEASPVPILITRLSEDRILYINRRAAETFALDPEESVGQKAPEYWVNTSERLRLFDLVRQQGSAQDYEAWLKGPGGRSFWALISAKRMIYAGELSVFIAFSDITQRKRMEEDLTGKTNILQATLENMGQGIVVADADHRIVAYNSRVLAMFLLEEDSFGERSDILSFPRLWIGDEADMADRPGEERKAILERLDRGDTYNEEITGPGGRVVEILHNSLPNGGLVRTYTDITERKAAQRRILDQLQFQRTLFDTIPNPIFYKDSELRFLGCNRQFAEQVIGRPQEELIGRRVSDVAPDSNRLLLEQWDRAHLAQGDPRFVDEHSLAFADGSAHQVIINAGRFFDSAGESAGVVGMLVDITELKQTQDKMRRAREEADQAQAELKQTQESLAQAEKLAALGQLVAGVAHEINTPVGIGVTGASHLVRKTKEMSDKFSSGRISKGEFKGFLELTDETGRLLLANMDRAAGLIQSFKKVAVDQTSDHRRRFGLKGYIDEILLSLHPRLKKVPHQVAIDCPDEVEFDSYPGAFARVLTNFIMNSLLHGFPPEKYNEDHPGHMHITCERLEDDRVKIVYADDGVGIPQDNIDKIFDPFFTTRRGSGGSGLGLAIVRDLIYETLGGEVQVESIPGEKTVFTMVLPLCGPEPKKG